MSGDDWINVSILMAWALPMIFFPGSIIRLHVWLTARGVKPRPPREMAVRIIGVIVLLVAVITILRAGR